MVFLRLLQPLGIDFIQFYEASLMWLHGLNPYTRLLSSPGPFNYPPTAFLFLWWPGLFSLVTSAVIWNLASLAAFLVSIYLLLKLVYKNRFSWWLFALFTALFTLPFFPVKYTLDSGQINNFILLWIVLAMWYDVYDRPWLSAVSLMLAALIKLSPLIFVIVYLATRRFTQLFRLAIVGLLCMSVPFIVFPLKDLSVYFFKVFRQPFTLSGKAVYYNQSLLGLLTRTFPTRLVIPLYTVMLIVMVFFAWQYLKTSSRVSAYAILSCLLLLISPISWQHHFVFALIPLIYVSSLISVRWWGSVYALIALNLASPQSLPASISLFRSHQTLGAILLMFTILVAALNQRQKLSPLIQSATNVSPPRQSSSTLVRL